MNCLKLNVVKLGLEVQALNMNKKHNGRKTQKIHCKKCGKIRYTTTANWKQVKYCIECYYYEKRKYNSEYKKRWRMKKQKR